MITMVLLIIRGWFPMYRAFGKKVGWDKALPTENGVLPIDPRSVLPFFAGIASLLPRMTRRFDTVHLTLKRGQPTKTLHSERSR